MEVLPLLTIGRHLHIDAVNGSLYWTTTHTVETAKLNGEKRSVYYQAGLFSGKRGESTVSEMY